MYGYARWERVPFKNGGGEAEIDAGHASHRPADEEGVDRPP